MKKILALLLLLFLALPSYATYWYEYKNKSYIDLDSVSGGVDYWGTSLKRAWVKRLNPGNWDLEKNKKIWYWMDYIEVDCTKNVLKMNTLHHTSYDTNGDVINTWEDNVGLFYYVVPGSVGESAAKAICSSPIVNR